jgi:hypothetical protein
MAKVIKFPSKYIPVKTPETMKELADNIVGVHIAHAEAIIDDITQAFVARVRREGILLEKLGDVAEMDITMIRNAMRASILRFYGIEYSFQKLADEHLIHFKKQRANAEQIEKDNPMMKTELEPEDDPGPMIG